MGRCVIHIGMHKTGSTSIQHSLRGFEDAHFLYADLDRSGNHSLPIYTLFAAHPERHHMHRAGGRDAAALEGYIGETRRRLEDCLAAMKERTLILSGEDISILPPDALVRMRDYFQGRVDELTVVGYVRAPGGYMASSFQEHVKGGVMEQINLDRIYRNYQNTFAKFDEVFGRVNVQLWKYDVKSFPGGCAVQDFCARLGIRLPAERVVRLNESLSRQAVALIYTYRKFGEAYGSRTMNAPESMKLGIRLADAGKDRFRFSADALGPVLAKHRSDIEWMEARLGASLREEQNGHRPGDVRDESDLLHAGVETLQSLRTLLGAHAPAEAGGETPQDAALLVHAFRMKAAKSAGPSRKVSVGRVVQAETDRVVGWAIGADPAQPILVSLIVNGKSIAKALADRARPGLKEREIHPTGNCGFLFRLTSDQRLRVGDEVTVKPLDDAADFEITPLIVGVGKR